jgi:hypothetical protein
MAISEQSEKTGSLARFGMGSTSACQIRRQKEKNPKSKLCGVFQKNDRLQSKQQSRD